MKNNVDNPNRNTTYTREKRVIKLFMATCNDDVGAGKCDEIFSVLSGLPKSVVSGLLMLRHACSITRTQNWYELGKNSVHMHYWNFKEVRRYGKLQIRVWSYFVKMETILRNLLLKQQRHRSRLVNMCSKPKIWNSFRQNEELPKINSMNERPLGHAQLFLPLGVLSNRRCSAPASSCNTFWFVWKLKIGAGFFLAMRLHNSYSSGYCRDLGCFAFLFAFISNSGTQSARE